MVHQDTTRLKLVAFYGDISAIEIAATKAIFENTMCINFWVTNVINKNKTEHLLRFDVWHLKITILNIK